MAVLSCGPHWLAGLSSIVHSEAMPSQEDGLRNSPIHVLACESLSGRPCGRVAARDPNG